MGSLHRPVSWTAGCVAVTNPEIEEIYKLVPVHRLKYRPMRKPVEHSETVDPKTGNVHLTIPLMATTKSVLNLCDVVDNWKNYHQQRVRIRAVFAVGPEMGWLYDPACQNGKGLTDVELRKDAKSAIKKLDQLLVKEKRAWVVLEGVFYGPEAYQNVDPKLPPAIRERLENHRGVTVTWTPSRA